MIPAPELQKQATLPETRRWGVDALFVGLACVMFGLAQVGWAGYQMGVGNQGIQIAFLEALHDPHLFARDAMVSQTLSQYPSWFFWLCAGLLGVLPLTVLYLGLQLLATVGVFLAVAALSRAMFREEETDGHWGGLVAVVFMLAGHHQALAGETLYSTGLTHTWVVFPLTLFSLALFFRGRYLWAVGLLGAAFNFHALEAGHLMLAMGFAGICQWRRIGITKLLGMGNVFLLTASPTLVLLLRQHAGAGAGAGVVFDAQWLELMQVRSADHSFPSTWWQAGSADLPRFLCVMGLAAVALAFWKKTAERKTAYLLMGGFALMFVVGELFTDVWPVAVVIRAQFFRSSRVLMVLALIVIGHGCVCAWRLPWDRGAGVRKWVAWLEFGSACLTAGVLAVPGFLSLLPWALLLATMTALISGRLAWYQAMVAGAGLLTALLAWEMVQFVIPGISVGGGIWKMMGEFRGPTGLGWGMILAGGILWWVAYRQPRGMARTYGLVLSGAAAVGLVMGVFPALLKAPANDAPWVDVQEWARGHTAREALFLTPAKQSGFRIHSERAIVGEWRDGTQLYFSPAFAAVWWSRMNDLQPGLRVAPDAKEVFDWGHPLAMLDDEEIVDVAKRYQADYVVLPYKSGRRLRLVYGNSEWAIYAPALEVVASAPVVSVTQATDFMGRVVLPNIEKYRKSDGRVQVVDGAGRPIEGLRYTLVEKKSAFGMGCSLSYFKMPAVDFGSDYVSPVMNETELSRFLEVFNYSVMPFGGNWAVMESQPGKVDYADVDQYVDWCTKHGVRVEFSFLTGNQPGWVQGKTRTEQTRQAVARARALVERYGNKIDSWQVTAERMGELQAPAVIGELRKMAPGIRLGIAEDTRFWSARTGDLKEGDTLRGMEELHWLKSKGVSVDFVPLEAHQPTGLRADAEEMYQTLDAFAKEGVQVHVTQLGVPVGARIEGGVKQGAGGEWTAELQAEYYRQFFTVCFSHPDVDAVNVFALGAKQWMDGEGLLDEKDRPTAAFLALQELITRRWRTELSGKFDPAGAAAFRGFQGEYELTVTTASGRAVTASLSVLAGQENRYRFRLDATAGTLMLLEKP